MSTRFELGVNFRNRHYDNVDDGLLDFYKIIKKGWDGSAKVVSRELTTFLNSVADVMVQKHSGAWPGGTSSDTLSKRSGEMLKSIVESVEVSGTTLSTIRGTIGGSRIAAVHEFGATIRPRKAKYLTVPLPAALNADGTPRKKSAREWSNTFVAKTKAGNLVIFQKRGTQIVPLYVLKTSVTIPPRLGLRKAYESGLPHFVERTVDAIVQEIIESRGF